MTSNLMVPAAAGGMPAPTRRAVLIGSTTAAALVGLTASAALAEIPSWMELRIEAHRDTWEALGRVVALADVHETAFARSPARAEDAELLAARDAVRQACERNDEAFRALLAERPRNMAESTLRARYLAEECEEEIGGHEDFIGLLLGSMTGGRADR